MRPCLSLWYRQTALRYTRLSIRPLEGDHQVGHVRPGRAGVDEIAARLQKTTCIGATQVIHRIEPLERAAREGAAVDQRARVPAGAVAASPPRGQPPDPAVPRAHGRRGVGQLLTAPAPPTVLAGYD